MNLSKQERKEKNRTIQVQAGLLPSAFNVTEALAARQFEIKAMEQAIANGSEHTGNLRVFQTVPRYMRRRAASHNVKRLPKYVRKRALAQMAKDPVHKPKKKESRKAQRKPARLLSKILTTPGYKKWLETHIWHAKRMKMEERWGLKIPIHTNQKSLRFAVRTMKYGSMIHDMSFMRIIQIHGNQKSIIEAFSSITDPTVPSIGAKKYINGSRSGTAFLHSIYAYPKAAICPVQFFWASNGKLWIWVHPNVYRRVYCLIQQALQGDMEDEIQENDKDEATVGGVQVKCMNNEFVKFSFTGPRTHSILAHALTLADVDENKDAHTMWNQIKNISNPSTLPPGIVLALTIQDPRPSDSAWVEICDRVVAWPTGLATSQIHDVERNSNIFGSRDSNANINLRRSANSLPGTALEPLSSDAKIPILLLHRGSFNAVNNNKRLDVNFGWDLVAPKGWGLPLWNLFTFSGARVGGLRDFNIVHFESNLAAFPKDHPETPSYEYETMIEVQAKKTKYNRTPKLYRFDYSKTNFKNPFAPDFKELLGVDKDEQITVMHSQRLVDLLKEQLLEVQKYRNFDQFAETYLGKLKTLINQRSFAASLKEMNHETVKHMFCRVMVVLKEGAVEPNSAICIPSADTMDKKLDIETVLGYTTSGGFQINSGKSVAIGCCTLHGLYRLYSSNQVHVGVKTPRGRLERTAAIDIIA
ncbi:hypothetical protein HDV01_007714 [Terramyces sp. JEL0728]|nr:hypothetical protein HDV01_007714 [Terramyces sp. JEL0728]